MAIDARRDADLGAALEDAAAAMRDLKRAEKEGAPDESLASFRALIVTPRLDRLRALLVAVAMLCLLTGCGDLFTAADPVASVPDASSAVFPSVRATPTDAGAPALPPDPDGFVDGGCWYPTGHAGTGTCSCIQAGPLPGCVWDEDCPAGEVCDRDTTPPAGKACGGCQ